MYNLRIVQSSSQIFDQKLEHKYLNTLLRCEQWSRAYIFYDTIFAQKLKHSTVHFPMYVTKLAQFAHSTSF